MKNRSLDFTRGASKKRTPILIAAIVAVVIAAGALSFVVLLAMNDFDVARFFGTREAEETTTQVSDDAVTEPVSTAPAFSDENSMNFLLLCGDSDKNIAFCDVVCISYAENVIRVKPVSPELTLEYGGGEYSLSKLYALSSATAVKEALNRRGMNICRHVDVSETNFKMILQRLGPVDILLGSDVRFSVDAITYTYSAGRQTMTSDALLKYMKYAAEGDEQLGVQAEAFAQVLRTHFTSELVERGEDYFASLINLVDSDISAFDYTENRAGLSAFLAKKPPVNVIS